MNNKIILYPSNWLYNAGVVGFLRILDELKVKYKGDTFIMINFDDENLKKLDLDKIFKKWDETTKVKLKISYENKSGGTQKYYYSNQTEKIIEDKIKRLLQSTPKTQKKGKKRKELILSCSFCGTIQSTYKNQLNVLNQAFGNILLGSEKSFPNTYWMMESKEFVCPKCEFILMCHHIPFVSIDEKNDEKNKVEIFINTPNFQLTYDLNKFAEEILKKDKTYEIRKLLGSSLLQWAIKRKTLLGAWTITNIEIIIKRIQVKKNKRETIIDYFDLPYHITRILLDYEIAALIKKIGEEKIFDLIVNGKFSELEKATYFVLKGLMKLKNNEQLSENDPITKYVDNYTDREHLSKISNLLPELYAKIIKILKMEVKHG